MKTMKSALFYFALFLGLIIISQSVSAYDTTVNIPMLKDYNLSIKFNVNDASSPITLNATEVYSNFQNSLTFSFSTSVSKISFYVLAFSNNQATKIISKKFDNYTAGGIINLDLFNVSSSPAVASAPATPAVNNSNNSTANSSSNITSNQTSSKESFFSKIKIDWKKTGLWAGYIVGGIIILIGIFFGIKYAKPLIKRKMMQRREYISFKKDDSKVFNYSGDRELMDAERKIKEAQSEIEAIKNKRKRIAEAQRKFEESKRELERVRDEE